MKKIIAATDFSATSLNAVLYATELALDQKADLLLFHVYTLPISYTELQVMMTAEEMHSRAEEDIREMKEMIEAKTGKTIQVTTEVRNGLFYKELEHFCAEVKPYLVIMGSQGKNAAERFFMGSQSVYAMKHLQYPLVTIPSGVQYAGIRNIGFACDFENVMQTIPVEELKKLVEDFKADLYILNISKERAFNPDVVFGSGLLQKIMAPIIPKYQFITHENVNEGILDFAHKNKLDLLIVVPKHRGMLDDFIHKSHTKQLVLHSHVPVMALTHKIPEAASH